MNAPPAGDNAGPSGQGQAAPAVDDQAPDGQAAPAKKRRIRRKPVPTSQRPAKMRRQAEYFQLMEMPAA